MKNFISSFLIVFVCFLLSSCNNSDYHNKINIESQKFYTSISVNQRQLIIQFLKGSNELSKDFKRLNGGFYCLWKTRNRHIKPHTELNTIFKNAGYNITYKKDSIKFVIISETISHVVGTYNNGGNATQLESIVSVIDFSSGKSYLIKKVLGDAPPQSIKRSKTNKTGATGNPLSAQQIYYLSIAEILKTI